MKSLSSLVRRVRRPAALGIVASMVMLAGATGLRPVDPTDAPIASALVAAGSSTELQVAGRAGVPDDATAASINFTAVDATDNGYLTAYPCNAKRPTASTLNYRPGANVGNSTIVTLDPDGKVCIYNHSATNVVADIGGYFTGRSYTGITPERIHDTRPPKPPSNPTPQPPGNPVPPGDAVFVETFDGNTGMANFDRHVYHRNLDDLGYAGYSGGSWTGDHDVSCGSPDTQRPLRLNANDSQATRIANSFYTCKDHMMTSMGDVEAYSVVAFSPKTVFDNVSGIQVDVNLTDLGTRQWLKFGVLSTSDCPSLNMRCMYSDVAASNLNTDLEGPGRLIASWNGGASAGYPGGLKIGNRGVSGQFDAGSDKATRYPVSFVDNGNGTVTFTVAGISRTTSGSFPECPCRVVFYDHNYTPDKSVEETGRLPIGHTWHWDNVIVRG